MRRQRTKIFVMECCDACGVVTMLRVESMRHTRQGKLFRDDAGKRRRL